MPHDFHQVIVGQLYALLLMLTRTRIQGRVRVAPVTVVLSDDDAVEPDIFWVNPLNSDCVQREGRWYGAPDLVVEVLSPGSRRRDRVEKFLLYEQHGVREYWLIDPTERRLEQWLRVGNRFQDIGTFHENETFNSPTLGGTQIDLTGIFQDNA